jgi:hypothetical protein
MYDFSSFEFSRAKTALCVAILCAAVVASLSDLFRIQTIFAPAQHVKSAFYLKWSGRSTAVKKSDVDWEIRPLTGKQVSLTVLTVPLLAMGLIVSNEMGAVRKFSAINAGDTSNDVACLLALCCCDSFELFCSCSCRSTVFRRFQCKHSGPSHSSDGFFDIFVVLFCVGIGDLHDDWACPWPHPARHHSGVFSHIFLIILLQFFTFLQIDESSFTHLLISSFATLTFCPLSGNACMHFPIPIPL